METLFLDGIDPVAKDAAIRRAAELLAAGEVVALPTETVYGLGVNADDPAAIARLRAVKGRGEEKPFTIACAHAKTALERAAPLPRTAVRLARRFWPGPLTLVVPDRTGASVGLRVPGHALTRAVLESGPPAVALSSANPSGETPAIDAQEVRAVFAGRIAAVLDGGRAAIGQPSTIVRADQNGLEVLRTGILSAEDVLNAATVKVLFVCSGNTCRSPMAAALLEAALARRLSVRSDRLESHGFRVQSAGLFADGGRPASAGALSAMERRGIELRGHRSRLLTRPMLEAQDRVYAMTAEIARNLRRATPHPERIQLLDPEGRDVPDPYGGSDADYQECALVIERHVNKIVEELVS